MVALSPRLLTRRGGTGISSSRLAVTRAAAFGSSSAFDNVFDEPPGDMDEYGEVGRGPAVTSEIIRRDRGGKFEKAYHLGAFADKKKAKLGKSAIAQRDAFWADIRTQSQSKYVKVTQLNKDRREARKKHREELGSVEEGPQATKALEEFFEEGQVAEDLKSKFGELPQVGFVPMASISTLGDPLERTMDRKEPPRTADEVEVQTKNEVTEFMEKSMLTPEKGRLESLLQGSSSNVESLLTSNPECLALQHRLSKSKTSGQVLALVADELERMDGINLATALHRVAKHSKSYQVSQVATDPRYTALVDRLGAYLNSLDGVGLMNTLWALVRLNAAAPKWISELLDRCISSVDQLEPKQLGQGLYCVYRMSKHAAPTEAVKALQSALHGQVRASLDHFSDSHELVSVCTSLAKLGIRDETVFSALGSRLSDKMDDFDMEDIAAVSWAFARAKFTDRELFRKIRESLTVRTTECSVKSLVSLTWSLSKLGETGGEEDLFRYTLAPTIRSYMLEYTVQDLCALAWSFANANVHDVDFMSDIAHALMPKTRDMNCQDVCSAVVALASLHYSHKELFEALKQQSFRLMHTFTPLQLSRTLYGFGVAGVRDKKLFYEMTLTSIDKLHLMYAKNVCDILSALMEAEYLIPELTRPLLDHLSRQLDRLGPTECVQLLTVVAHVEPSEQRSSLGEAVAEQLRPKMKTTVRWIPSGPEIADVLQSFVLLELSNDRLLENTLMVLSPASKAPSCTSDIFLRILGCCADLPQRSRDAVKVLLHKHVGLQNAFNRLFEELCASTLSRLDQETVADVVYACARIGYDDGMFVQRLIEHVDQHLASSGGFHSFQSMARLVYALCELNTRLDMARVLCREAIDGQMWEGGSGDDVLLLAWAAVFLSLPPPVDLITEMCVLFEERLPTQLLLAQQIAVQLEYSDDYVDVSWEDPRVDIFVKDVRTIKRNDLYPVVYGKKANHRGTALMHTTTAASWVSAALEQLRIPHKTPFVIDNLYRVSAGFPARMAALDVLCPDSLVSPGGTRPLGSAAMRHRQLAALGWAVKEVTQREVYDAIVTRSVNSFIAKQIGPIHPNAVKYIEWGKVEIPDIEVREADRFSESAEAAGREETQRQYEEEMLADIFGQDPQPITTLGG